MISSKQTTKSILSIIVKPSSPVSRVDGVYNDRIRIFISAPPEKGKANKELIRFISGKTGIARPDISIVSGMRSNYKNLSVMVPEGFDLVSSLLKTDKA